MGRRKSRDSSYAAEQLKLSQDAVDPLQQLRAILRLGANLDCRTSARMALVGCRNKVVALDSLALIPYSLTDTDSFVRPRRSSPIMIDSGSLSVFNLFLAIQELLLSIFRMSSAPPLKCLLEQLEPSQGHLLPERC